jgi:hypothetical protein
MRKNRKRVLVKILNPIGVRTHTSMRCAADMVQRGIATYEPGVGLTLVNNIQLRLSSQAIEAGNRQREDDSITADRGGVFWWDGASPGTKSEPFPSSVFPNPGGARYRRSTALEAAA